MYCMANEKNIIKLASRNEAARSEVSHIELEERDPPPTLANITDLGTNRSGHGHHDNRMLPSNVPDRVHDMRER
jgi:hypothetical protein